MDTRPPKRALQFLRWFCREDFLEEIEGDLIEVFELRVQEDIKKASRSFWWQVIRHFRPDYIKSFEIANPLIRKAMLQNHLKIGWRHITKKKLYSFINITGLGVGMASCMLIMLFVKYEFSYDRYHENLDNTYRVLHSYKTHGEQTSNTSKESFQVCGNAPLANILKDNFPEIAHATRFTSPVSFLFQYKEQVFQEDNILYADGNTFEVFSWKMLEGNPTTALKDPNSVVLTQTLAKKYFGYENPVGKVMTINDKQSYKVTGLIDDIPINSSFKFEALVSMSTFENQYPSIFENWGFIDFYTYLSIHENTLIENLESKASELAHQYTSDWEDGIYSIAFEKLDGAYLHSVAQQQPGEQGSLSTIYIFISIAVFILIIACINFINLSTSRSLERAKEIGIRKVIGAKRITLISQFLAEFILLSLLAFLVAAGQVVLFSPVIQELTGKPIQYQDLVNGQVVLMLLGLVVLIGVLAGTYPAFLLSRFKPSKVLKGKFKSTGGGVALRKGLVVVQFKLSISLIIGTAIVFSQLDFMKSHELGFEEEQMMVVDFAGDGEVIGQREAIQNTLLNHPNVLSVAASRTVPGEFPPDAATMIENDQGEMISHLPVIYEIDDDFIQNYKIEVVAGRPFSKDFPTDTQQSLIVNESAVKLWGYQKPEDIIGKKFDQWGKKGVVVGVVKNFNFQSLKVEVAPLSLRYEPWSLRKFSIRVKPENIAATVSDLKETWAELVPHRPFNYTFLDQRFNDNYNADARFGKTFAVFAGIAIFIACLGLFGLTAYTIHQRAKEIGIRKVLGASVSSILTMLTSGFLKLFGIALLIAIPISWYVMTQWLENFAYRVEVNVFIFAVAGSIALGVALLTICWQSLKAASANPVKSLRSE